MKDNIVSLVGDKTEEEETSYIKIVFTDTSEEIIPCDFFGAMEGITNFIAVFQDETSNFPGHFYNTSLIKSIKSLKESETFLSGTTRLEIAYDV